LSSNLLKYGYVSQQTDMRVIDTNELAARRIEELAEKMRQPENEGFLEDGETDPADFVSGLAAETAEELLAESEDGEGTGDGEADDGEKPRRSNVIKAKKPSANDAAARKILEDAQADADRLIAQARAQAESDAMQLRSQMQAALVKEHDEAIRDAREQGYREGMEKAQAEVDRLRNELTQKEQSLEQEYQDILNEIEPQLIDTITGIYEHVFHVELRSYREVLVYLISTTMRKIEGNRNFLVHVSKEDYPFVSMQKKQIAASAAAPNSSVEIVEDLGLKKNECQIETDNGVFDCGLGTQLTELRHRLKLLSYDKSVDG